MRTLISRKIPRSECYVERRDLSVSHLKLTLLLAITCYLVLNHKALIAVELLRQLWTLRLPHLVPRPSFRPISRQASPRMRNPFQERLVATSLQQQRLLSWLHQRQDRSEEALLLSLRMPVSHRVCRSLRCRNVRPLQRAT